MGMYFFGGFKVLKGTEIEASVIQVRLAAILENYIGDAQCGFRSKRSTAEPLFCVHRLTDYAEQGHDPLFLIFLD